MAIRMSPGYHLSDMARKSKKSDNNKFLISVKKEIKFLDVALVSLFIFMIIFTVYHSIMVYRTMYEPSSLIVGVFGFCGFECGCMAGITKRKMTLKDIEYQEYNKKYDPHEQEPTDIKEITSEDLPQNQIKIDSIKDENIDAK